MTETEENVVPLKKDALDSKQVLLWRNRFKTANKFHRQKVSEKYKAAKKRYNSENFGFEKDKKKGYSHQTFNFLKKAIEDFNGATYAKNPQIDLTCRNTKDTVQCKNIENLEQDTNDDIKDNQSLKAMIRAAMVDEQLAGIGAFYIDYDYRTADSDEPLGEGFPDQFKQIEVANKVRPVKIQPENLIYPPFQRIFNYQESPYLGFIDIVSIECLKSDPTLDQAVVAKIKGKPYLELSDFDKEQMKSDGIEMNDDLLYAKNYYGWIKGDDGGPLKRIVLSDDAAIKEPLAYEDWDKGNGPDGKGYPIHILALNDSCEGFVPPSEAWVLDSILCIIDYLMQKMTKHLKRSKTRTLVKGGKDGMKKENIEKFLSSEDLEIISLHNLPPGLNIQSLVMPLIDQPLSADHAAMFELCKRVFDELSRKPSFAQVAVQEQKKTATEAEAIQSQDNSDQGYKVDKFRDFLIGFFGDWARLKQRNYRGAKSITVQNGETGEEESRDVVVSEGRNDFEGEFNADISLETFLAPNKALKRKQIQETIVSLQGMVPLLGGKKRINGERAMMDMLQNVDVRNPDEYLIDVPVRNVDQQVTDLVFKQIPMNIEDLGSDYQGAIQRLMQIFGDHDLMAKMSQTVPNIGGPDSPLVLMMKDLQGMMQQAQGQKPSNAGSDMAMGASQMAEAQK
jgi:hypothetical protein